MPGYSKEEKDAIVRQYLSPGGSQVPPLCRLCGEELKFRLDYRNRERESQILVDCPGCANGFSWKSVPEAESWDPLHMEYFEERMHRNQVIRCPLCDCSITFFEFSDGRVEFRCAFCNRRGQAEGRRHWFRWESLDTPVTLKV